MNEYEKQAKDFLKRHDLNMRIRRTNSGKCPPFCRGDHVHGEEFKITIIRDSRKVGVRRKKSISFSFWNSLADLQDGKKPTPYSILACISSDLYCPDTFKEYCEEFGINSYDDYEHWKIWSRFAKRLRKFFTPLEIRDLMEIV